MVDEQLINRGIKDLRVIAALRKVPRHEFVPPEHRDSAYQDFPLSIGEGQTISQPYIVALMSESLGLEGEETVLEIGTGSGYQAAILAELARQVYSIERLPGLAQKAIKNLHKLGYQNVEIKTADGTMGWKEYAPFAAIAVTAAAPQIPQPLVDQLAWGGRLVIPQGGRFTQILTLVTKGKDKLQKQDLCGCIFVPLLGQYAWKEKDAQ